MPRKRSDAEALYGTRFLEAVQGDAASGGGPVEAFGGLTEEAREGLLHLLSLMIVKRAARGRVWR